MRIKDVGFLGSLLKKIATRVTLTAPPNPKVVVASSPNQYQVTADAVAGAAGYRLYSSATEDGTYSALAGSLTAPAYTDSISGLYYRWQTLGNGSTFLDSAQGQTFMLTQEGGGLLTPITQWVRYTQQNGAASYVQDSATGLTINITGGTVSNMVQLRNRQGNRLQNGQVYDFSFDAKSSAPVTLIVTGEGGAPNYAALGLSYEFTTSTTFQTFTTQFTATNLSGTDSDNIPSFQLGALAGTTLSFDNVRVMLKQGVGITYPDAPVVSLDDQTRVLSATHPLGTEEIEYAVNSGVWQAYAPLSIDDLAHEANQWTYRTRRATNREVSSIAGSPRIFARYVPQPGQSLLTAFPQWARYTQQNGAASYTTLGSTEVQVQITAGGGSNSVQLRNKQNVLTNNQDYTFSFYAKAATPVTLSLTSNFDQPPYNGLGLNTSVDITTAYQFFSVDFTASQLSGTDSDSIPSFQLGSAVGNMLTLKDAVLIARKPIAPSVKYTPQTRVLTASHPLGTAELEMSVSGGAYVPYQDTVPSGSAHAAGDYQFRAKSTGGRPASEATPSPSIGAVIAGATTGDQQGIVRLDITLANLADVNPDTKTQCSLFFSNAVGSTYGQTNLYSGLSSIKVRGNYTAGAPKKPFSLGLLAANGVDDGKCPLLGMYNDSDFNLLAEYFDPTLARNAATLYLAAKIGLTAPQFRPCQVYINGDFYGLFTLTEKIKNSTSTVNLDKLGTGAADQVLPQMSGGYLFQKILDSQEDLLAETTFKTPLYGDDYAGPAWQTAHSISIDYPKFGKITADQQAYATDFFTRSEASLSRPWADMTNGPQAFFDAPALVRFYYAQELSKNQDGESHSSYWFKKRNGKLVGGPAWDFDAAYSVYNGVNAKGVTGEWIRLTPWYAKLFADAGFLAYAKSLYPALASAAAELPAYIDAYTNRLVSSGLLAQDAGKWNTYVQASALADGMGSPLTYAQHVTLLKNFITGRSAWIDTVLT